jgi:hypothetical protein
VRRDLGVLAAFFDAAERDIYRQPVWRFWGIVLGVLLTGFVFLFAFPEYTSGKVVGGLKKLTGTILA